MTSSPDVLVIGGGIVGAATAYHLARRGVSVTLLEADHLASGATGRNLGFIWLHTRKKGPELDLVMATRIGLESLPDELGEDFGLRTNGGLIYAVTEAQAIVMREFVDARVADGLAMEYLTGDEARALAPILPETVVAASFCPLDAQMDSRRYVRAFANAAQRAGATIEEGAAVRTLKTTGRRITSVDTDSGPITAGQVVLAHVGLRLDDARPPDLAIQSPHEDAAQQVLGHRLGATSVEAARQDGHEHGMGRPGLGIPPGQLSARRRPSTQLGGPRLVKGRNAGWPWCAGRREP